MHGEATHPAVENSDVNPNENRLRLQDHSEGSQHSCLHIARELCDLCRGCSPCVDQRKTVLARDGGSRSRQAESARHPGVLDEPGRAQLDGAVFVLRDDAGWRSRSYGFGPSERVEQTFESVPLSKEQDVTITIRPIGKNNYQLSPFPLASTGAEFAFCGRRINPSDGNMPGGWPAALKQLPTEWENFRLLAG